MYLCAQQLAVHVLLEADVMWRADEAVSLKHLAQVLHHVLLASRRLAEGQCVILVRLTAAVNALGAAQPRGQALMSTMRNRHSAHAGRRAALWALGIDMRDTRARRCSQGK
jgi:hypothetical protein